MTGRQRCKRENRHRSKIDDLQNYCLGTRRGIAADCGRPAVGFVYIPNEKLVHFIFSLWPFSSENHAPKGPERKRNIYRFLPASAVQPEGPCEMFVAVLVLIFVLVLALPLSQLCIYLRPNLCLL